MRAFDLNIISGYKLYIFLISQLFLDPYALNKSTAELDFPFSFFLYFFFMLFLN